MKSNDAAKEEDYLWMQPKDMSHFMVTCSFVFDQTLQQ
jgi:hypothetical protein